MLKMSSKIAKPLFLLIPAAMLVFSSASYAEKALYLTVKNHSKNKITIRAIESGCSDVADDNKEIEIQPKGEYIVNFNRSTKCSGEQGQIVVKARWHSDEDDPFSTKWTAWPLDFSNNGWFTFKSISNYPKPGNDFFYWDLRGLTNSLKMGTRRTLSCGWNNKDYCQSPLELIIKRTRG